MSTVANSSLSMDGETDGGDDLLSVETNDGERYWFAERDRTTLELRSIDYNDGTVPSSVVSGMVYEDLPQEVRVALKRDGYRMVGRNSFLARMM